MTTTDIQGSESFFAPEFPVFLAANEVVRRTSLSRTTIDRMVKEREFPRPVPIGATRKAWIEEEVTAWQMAIKAKRDEV
tara:strand:- start:1465 stop:1701 length:237 start_codon:yes stop_codon:yes gene_type:complete